MHDFNCIDSPHRDLLVLERITKASTFCLAGWWYPAAGQHRRHRSGDNWATAVGDYLFYSFLDQLLKPSRMKYKCKML